MSLVAAAKEGNVDTVKKKLKEGADVNETDGVSMKYKSK